MPVENMEKGNGAAREMPSVPVSIFGSCVSRDALEFIRPGAICLKTYIARQCISSAVARPVPVKEEDIPLKSRFQRRMVYYDIAKKTFELLGQDKSWFLLLDLVDERFPPVLYKGSTVTLSNELAASGLLGTKAPRPQRTMRRRGLFHPKRYYYTGMRPLQKDIEVFCKRLLEIYSPRQVILHRVRLADFYNSKEGAAVKFPQNYLDFNSRTNQLLDFMYDGFEGLLAGCRVIDISRDFHADEAHKWGLSPMHYQKEYYAAVAKRIEEIVLPQNELFGP